MIILGIGSNLSSKYGDRFKNIELSILQLQSYGIKIIKKSSFYETPSYPDNKKPKFINMVTMIETYLPPVDLMSILVFIEEKLERKRNLKNDPRTCDMDIIDYNGQIENLNYGSLNLHLPHKDLISRNFVLIPLIEICPNWIHPKTKENIETLVGKLSIEKKKSILKIKRN